MSGLTEWQKRRGVSVPKKAAPKAEKKKAAPKAVKKKG